MSAPDCVLDMLAPSPDLGTTGVQYAGYTASEGREAFLFDVEWRARWPAAPPPHPLTSVYIHTDHASARGKDQEGFTRFYVDPSRLLAFLREIARMMKGEIP